MKHNTLKLSRTAFVTGWDSQLGSRDVVLTLTGNLIGQLHNFEISCHLCGTDHGLMSGWGITHGAAVHRARYRPITPSWTLAVLYKVGYYDPYINDFRTQFDDLELARLQPFEVAVCTDRAVCIDARRHADAYKPGYYGVTSQGAKYHLVSNHKDHWLAFDLYSTFAICGARIDVDCKVARSVEDLCQRCEQINAAQVTESWIRDRNTRSRWLT